MKKPLLLTVIFLLTLGVSSASAMYHQDDTQVSTTQTGKKISFQGNLYENGLPVTGERQFVFRIDLGNGGNWTETQKTSVLNGLYSVVLGAVNPLPYDLFFEAEERTIQVSIGNTVLGSSILYAPFALKNDDKEFGTAIFQLEAMSVNDTVALTGEIYGVGNNSEYAAGLRGFAHTDTTSNTGVSGISYGGPDNKAYNTAVRGDAYANTPEAWATGTWGIGNSQNGGIAYGVRGEVYGQGSGFTAATRGLNFMTPSENGTRYGGYFTTHPAAEVHSGTSIGLGGFARGSEINIGLLGRASGGEGTVNYAGVFEEAPLNLRNGSSLVLNKGENNPKAELFINDQSAGALHLRSSVDSLTVLIDSNGEKAGLIHLNDSLGRESIGMFAYAGNGGQMRMSAGMPNTGETRVTAQVVSTLNPFINLIGRDEDGNAKGRAQMGNLSGNLGSGFRVTDPNFRMLVNIEGNTTNGGQLSMEGPNTSNFFLAGKFWEGNADLPFLALRGSIAKDNGNGGTYNEDMAIITVNRNNDDGSETGELALRHVAADGTSSYTSLNYFQLENLLNNSNGVSLGYNSNDSGLLFNLGSNGNNAGFGLLELFGTQNVDDGNGGTYTPPLVQLLTEYDEFQAVEHGVLQLSNQVGSTKLALRAENSGKLMLFSPNNNRTAQIRSTNNSNGENGIAEFYSNNNLKAEIGASDNNSGYAKLFGANGDNLMNIEVADINGVEERGTISMYSSAGASTIIEAGAIRIPDSSNGDFNSLLSGNAILFNGSNSRQAQFSSDLWFMNNGNGLFTSHTERELTFSENGTSSFDFQSATGNLTISGTLAQSSDARLKKNIATLTSGLATITQLRGVSYNWKDDSKPENKIGFIAQEVEKVLPELVITKEDGFKAVSYAEMTAVLVEAVKELNAKVGKLEAENTELKAERSELKAEVEKVEILAERLAQIEALLNSAKPNKTNK